MCSRARETEAVRACLPPSMATLQPSQATCRTYRCTRRCTTKPPARSPTSAAWRPPVAPCTLRGAATVCSVGPSSRHSCTECRARSPASAGCAAPRWRPSAAPACLLLLRVGADVPALAGKDAHPAPRAPLRRVQRVGAPGRGASLGHAEAYGNREPSRWHALGRAPRMLALAGAARRCHARRLASVACKMAAAAQGARGGAWRALGLTSMASRCRGASAASSLRQACAAARSSAQRRAAHASGRLCRGHGARGVGGACARVGSAPTRPATATTCRAASSSEGLGPRTPTAEELLAAVTARTGPLSAEHPLREGGRRSTAGAAPARAPEEGEDDADAAAAPEGPPLVLAVSGPSGVGKDTVLRRLLEVRPELHFIVTMASRPPRPDEVRTPVDGVDYFFVSKEQFERNIAQGEMLEHATVYGEYKVPLAPRFAPPRGSTRLPSSQTDCRHATRAYPRGGCDPDEAPRRREHLHICRVGAGARPAVTLAASDTHRAMATPTLPETAPPWHTQLVPAQHGVHRECADPGVHRPRGALPPSGV
eukprot:scaffold207_cov409-Prasinococcus_capsulatus_cf.AAC.17